MRIINNMKFSIRFRQKKFKNNLYVKAPNSSRKEEYIRRHAHQTMSTSKDSQEKKKYEKEKKEKNKKKKGKKEKK